MKPKEIQELLDFIAQSGLSEVSIETEQLKLAVKKYAEPSITHPQITQPVHQMVAAPVQQQATAAQPAPVKTEAAPAEPAGNNLITIKSPMIGTFYRSANPESPSFVNIGDDINPGQTVCIIEAMKLFNEIESEVSGKIVKILVENATPVEYDQPLFLIQPK